MADYHVVKRPGDKWAALRANAKRDTAVFEDQSDAFKLARKIVTNQGGEVLVHGRDGKIREKNTYGKTDPEKTRG